VSTSGAAAGSLPRISVVTPCLNAEATIERTIASVWSQGYPNLQHVVVDGGSTDRTLELVARHPQIEVVSEPDRGLSDALNKGYRLAQGELIGWLNADDLYLPGALRAVAEAAAKEPDALWVTGHCRIIDGDDVEIRRSVTRYKSAFLRRYRYPSLLVQNFISAPATFVTPEGLQRAGEVRLDQRYSMDYDLWLRLGRLSRPAIVPHEIAAFRMVEGTLSMTGFEHQFREHAAISWAHARGLERAASAVNQVVSRGIVLTYRAMAAVRRRRAST
jgi:glycosyltransferase involved in cell wall biosynthesis